jgi:hypothetical protein
VTKPKIDRGGKELFADLSFKRAPLQIRADSTDRQLAFCASGFSDERFEIDPAQAWSVLYARYPDELRFRIFALYERCKAAELLLLDVAPQHVADEIIALTAASANNPAARALLRRVVLWQKPRLASLGQSPALSDAAAALGIDLVPDPPKPGPGWMGDVSESQAKAREQLALLWFAFLGELDEQTRRDQKWERG